MENSVPWKRLILGAAVAVVVVAAGVIYFRTWRSGNNGNASPVSESQTRQEVPDNVTVPGKDAENVPANIAVPDVVGPAGENTEASFRGFEISVGGGKFSPDTVAVNKGDTVHIKFTAGESGYDFTQPDYGLKLSLPKGEAKIVEFGATATGKFTFYCTACGGPDKGPLGYIIVK